MVDEIRVWPHAKHRCFKAGSCHLTIIDEPIDNLHAFAKSIGLKREWFQEHAIASHYDLTVGRREAAVAAGAVFVTARDQAVARAAKRRAVMKI